MKHIGAKVSDMGVVVNRRSAAVKTGFSLMQRFKKLFTSSQSIKKGESHEYRVAEKREKMKWLLDIFCRKIDKMGKDGQDNCFGDRDKRY